MSFDLPDVRVEDCVFCSIVLGDADARWEARPTGNSNVACFHNRLKWARVMLLVVPVPHVTQHELWTLELLLEAARLAVEMGDKHCGDDGYRAISNFGLQAHQSQSHAHIHVVSGNSRQLDAAIEKSNLSSSEHSTIDEFAVEDTPFAARVTPARQMSQREMWTSNEILATSLSALETTESHSPDGYRLLSTFDPATESAPAGSNPASLFLLGGGQLGLYV